MTRHRHLAGPYLWGFRACSIVALIAAINQIFYLRLLGPSVVGSAYMYLLILLYIPLVFLLFPASERARDKVPWYDVVAAVVSFASPLYFFLTAERALAEAWEFNPPVVAQALSGIMLIAILEAGRRVAGGVFGAIVATFAFYPLIADRLPGILEGLGWGVVRLSSYHFGSQESIVGIPMRVVGELLIGFMVLAVGLNTVGAGQFFVELSSAIAGRARGAPAKVAVVSSGMFGSISGSPVANVITTGQFTIPAMKKAGYSPEYAGAVEACASTGGVLMPPIMGVAAFIMADFLEIPYATVVVAAVIPSFLYFLSLFLQVDAQAALRGMRGIPKDTALRPAGSVLAEGWFLLVGFAVLVWFLLVERREAQAPFYALGALLLSALVARRGRLGLRSLLEVIDGSGRVMAELTAILAAVGLIIGSLTMTGVALSLSREIINLAGGNAGLLLVLGAGVAFVLGMGVPLAPCYVILAILVAPALVETGLDPVAVHMFALYWATISFITPPVCLSAFTAAGISGASPMRTGFLSLRIGSVLLLVPFLFVLNPVLLLRGNAVEILVAVVTAASGVLAWTAGAEGYLVGLGAIPPVARLALGAAGFLLMVPGWETDLGGLGLMAVVVLAVRVSPALKRVAWRHKDHIG